MVLWGMCCAQKDPEEGEVRDAEPLADTFTDLPGSLGKQSGADPDTASNTSPGLRRDDDSTETSLVSGQTRDSNKKEAGNGSGQDRIARMKMACKIFEQITAEAALQVLRGDTWKNLSPLEVKQVSQQLSGGELRFPVVTSGIMYLFDFGADGDEEWCVENVTKKKKYKLRIHNADLVKKEEKLAAAEVKRSTDKSAKKRSGTPSKAAAKGDLGASPPTGSTSSRHREASSEGGKDKKDRQPRGGHQPKSSAQGQKPSERRRRGSGGGGGGESESESEMVRAHEAELRRERAKVAPKAKATAKRFGKAKAAPTRTVFKKWDDEEEEPAEEDEENEMMTSQRSRANTEVTEFQAGFTEQQEKYGPQSKRGSAPQDQLVVLQASSHAISCFDTFAQNEKKLCGEWACFYHSYSLAALLYEVQAAVAAILFKFRAEYAPLPRLMIKEFEEMEDVEDLVEKFETTYVNGMKDHDPGYREVAISAMCSLVALGPEASTPVVFMNGYSERDTNFLDVLERILECCEVPKSKMKNVVKDMVAIAEKWGLDASMFGGRDSEKGAKTGHMLQIFVNRGLVDCIAYASKPYGAVDQKRHPLSEWVDSDACMNFGQARLLAHPKWFMQADCVRMYAVSADPEFHHSRYRFQRELTARLKLILDEPGIRLRAAKRIYGSMFDDE